MVSQGKVSLKIYKLLKSFHFILNEVDKRWQTQQTSPRFPLEATATQFIGMIPELLSIYYESFTTITGSLALFP